MGPCRVLPWMPALFRASHVRLVSFAPALTPARCLVVPTINTVYQSFPFCFPGTTLSTGLQLFHPKAVFSAREREGSASRRHPSPGAPTSFAWDASLSSCNTPKPAAKPMMPIRLSFNELWCVLPSRTEEISSRLPGLRR